MIIFLKNFFTVADFFTNDVCDSPQDEINPSIVDEVNVQEILELLLSDLDHSMDTYWPQHALF